MAMSMLEERKNKEPWLSCTKIMSIPNSHNETNEFMYDYFTKIKP